MYVCPLNRDIYIYIYIENENENVSFENEQQFIVQVDPF